MIEKIKNQINKYPGLKCTQITLSTKNYEKLVNEVNELGLTFTGRMKILGTEIETGDYRSYRDVFSYSQDLTL